MKSLRGKLGKILLPVFLVTIFVVMPLVSIGAVWVQNVGLLPDTAIVFSNDAPAVDRIMAAVLKAVYGNRIGICDGTNDHVEIQAALDSVRSVRLSTGEFNCEVTIDIDNSDQAFRGCGWDTVLTTSTADLIFISAVGGAGSELTGITIRDMQIDGGAGKVSDVGIYLEYVDHSLVENVYSRRHGSGTGTYLRGIYLENSDFNTITDNTCSDNGNRDIAVSSSDNNVIADNICLVGGGNGIYLYDADGNTITGNTCQGHDYYGIYLRESTDNTVTGNTCPGNDTGILLYVATDNTVTGNTCSDNTQFGIWLYDSCDNNTINGNTCQGNDYDGMYVYDSDDNTIDGNTFQGNDDHGIHLDTSSDNTIDGNTFQGNGDAGLHVFDNGDNTITDNTCQGNGAYGIWLWASSHNTVVGNTLTENSQAANNLYSDLYLFDDCNFNNIQANTCRAGGLANVPKYGIGVGSADCDDNLIIDNDLSGGGWGTAPFNDAGTGTKLNVYVVPFSDGSAPQDSGFLIDSATEYARAWLRLPDKVVQVESIIVYARSGVTEADKMRAEFVVYGGADNEAYNTHDGSVANHPSTSSNFAADDIVYWTLTETGVLALVGGDSIEVQVIYEGAGNGDCATDAYFRTVEVEYV